VSAQANSQTAQNQACLSAFGTCRKYQDDVGPAISSCDQKPSALTSKLKSLLENQNMVNNAQAAIAKLTSGAGLRQSSTTCSDIISLTEQLKDLIDNNPASTRIADVAALLINASSVATCTAAEKQALQESNDEIRIAEQQIANEANFVQDTLSGK
jgi:hypothetical protein